MRNVEIIYPLLVAAPLYCLADWLPRRIEQAKGRTLEHRTLVFFLLLLGLTLVAFHFIGRLTG